MHHYTIGKKISAGFAVILILTSVLGVVAALTMRRVRTSAQHMRTAYVPEASRGSALNHAVARTQVAVRSYGFTAEEKYLLEVRAGLADIDREFAATRTLADSNPALEKLRQQVMALEAPLGAFKTAIDETETHNRTLTTSREHLINAVTIFSSSIHEIIASQNAALAREITAGIPAAQLAERHQKITLANDILEKGNEARVALFKAQAWRNPALISEGITLFTKMDADFAALRALLKNPEDIKELADTKAGADSYRQLMQQVQDGLLALDVIAQRRAEITEQLVALCNETADAGMQRTVTAADESATQLGRASVTVQAVLGSALLLGIAIAAFLTRAISRVLRAVTAALSAGSEQIVAAAAQVSGSSQSLAAGASQQAASLEETSASVEEMSSMTKRNAHSATQAREITRAARHSADESSAAVNKLNTAMGELKTSSAAVAKIVKSIDEIAFQTNLLAINAAVEAARAGEAGAGFAVVAEEVRSLAQRSALSAKETAEKIDHALAKSDEGARISEEVSRTLGGIIEQVHKLDGLVNGIAQASQEQSQGIEQINTSVAQIDKITQSNAAAAEESASASEELNAQANELNGVVGDLLRLVDGASSTGAGAHAAPRPAPSRARARPGAVITSPAGTVPAAAATADHFFR